MPTVADLGRKLKAKHPGSYDDMPDEVVGLKLQAKYPGSYDDFSPAGMVKPPEPKGIQGVPWGVPSSSPHMSFEETVGPGSRAGKIAHAIGNLSSYLPENPIALAVPRGTQVSTFLEMARNLGLTLGAGYGATKAAEKVGLSHPWAEAIGFATGALVGTRLSPEAMELLKKHGGPKGLLLDLMHGKSAPEAAPKPKLPFIRFPEQEPPGAPRVPIWGAEPTPEGLSPVQLGPIPRPVLPSGRPSPIQGAAEAPVVVPQRTPLWQQTGQAGPELAPEPFGPIPRPELQVRPTPVQPEAPAPRVPIWQQGQPTPVDHLSPEPFGPIPKPQLKPRPVPPPAPPAQPGALPATNPIQGAKTVQNVPQAAQTPATAPVATPTQTAMATPEASVQATQTAPVQGAASTTRKFEREEHALHSVGEESIAHKASNIHRHLSRGKTPQEIEANLAHLERLREQGIQTADMEAAAKAQRALEQIAKDAITSGRKEMYPSLPKITKKNPYGWYTTGLNPLPKLSPQGLPMRTTLDLVIDALRSGEWKSPYIHK